MKTETRRTLSLLPVDGKELSEWREALEPYAWADGEFGLVCTEAAFREFCAAAVGRAELSLEMKRAARDFGALLRTGQFADVCLDNGISA